MAWLVWLVFACGGDEVAPRLLIKVGGKLEKGKPFARKTSFFGLFTSEAVSTGMRTSGATWSGSPDDEST